MPTYTKTITITKQDGTTVATGTLVVDTSANPNTGTFTPTPSPPGTLIQCGGAPTWPTANGGTVNFWFSVPSGGNGVFVEGTYHFNGTQNSNGNPSGTISWPGPEGDEGGIENDRLEDRRIVNDYQGPEGDEGGIENDLWQASG